MFEKKSIIKGTLPGSRKRGRPRTAWTRLKLEEAIGKVDNRSAWKTAIQ